MYKNAIGYHGSVKSGTFFPCYVKKEKRGGFLVIVTEDSEEAEIGMWSFTEVGNLSDYATLEEAFSAVYDHVRMLGWCTV